MTTTMSAIGLPFAEAIDYLRQKTNVTSTGWTDVWQKANAKAFTVAGATTTALVEDFRREVAKALETGSTIQEFRKTFDDIVRRHGWDHVGKPGWRSRVIFETNLGMAYSAGRYAQQTEPATLAVFPYWQYVHSGAKHPRKQHLAWNGTVLRADDPFWDWAYPPNGWGCGCRVRPVSEAGLKRQGRSGVDQAPERLPIQTVDKKTGEILRGSEGVDFGFDYNPGRAWKAAPAAEVPGLPRPPGAPAAPPVPSPPRAFDAPAPPATELAIAEADRSMTQAYADWASRLTSAQREALSDYKGSAFRAMNEYLRGERETVASYLKTEIRDLDRALAKAAAPRDMRIVRGVGRADPAAKLGRRNKIMRYDQFASFSLESLTPAKFAEGAPRVLIEAKVPKGYTGIAYVNRVPDLDHLEHEFIFRPGTRFRIVERIEDAHEVRIVVEPIAEPGRRARIAPRRARGGDRS
ncbi:phage minor head protein [Bosea vestrisii]|uniref:Phage minor head protein n=1 Tax=Bosea vestrisii TaxID=151416 RepID=A0ABW0H828_9HYPH